MFKKLLLFFSICFFLVLVSCKQAKEKPLNALGEKLKTSKNIGLVLGGGAALGAYEAGVWKFLSERGISSNVRSVAGSSVGSLNGVLIVSRDDNGILSLWSDLDPSEILESRHSTDTNSSSSDLEMQDMQKNIHQHYESIHVVNAVPSNAPSCGGYSISNIGHFRATIEKKLNYQQFSSSDINFLLTRVKVGGLGTLEYVDKKNLLNAKSVVNNLLASTAAKPLFDCYSFDGKSYRDGGQAPRGNNIPWKKLESVYAPDIVIIISLIKGDEKLLPKGDKYVIFRLSRTYSIATDEVFFDKVFTRRLLSVGYRDAEKLLTQP